MEGEVEKREFRVNPINQIHISISIEFVIFRVNKEKFKCFIKNKSTLGAVHSFEAFPNPAVGQ